MNVSSRCPKINPLSFRFKRVDFELLRLLNIHGNSTPSNGPIEMGYCYCDITFFPLNSSVHLFICVCVCVYENYFIILYFYFFVLWHTTSADIVIVF